MPSKWLLGLHIHNIMYVHYILVKVLNCMSYTLGRAGLEECLQHDLCRPIIQLLFVTNKVCMCIYTYIVMSHLLHNTYTYIHKLNVVYIRIILCIEYYIIQHTYKKLYSSVLETIHKYMHVSVASVLIFIMEVVLTCTSASWLLW